MSAMSDVVSDAVTVTCQASLRELRAAAFWLYTHDRQTQIGILLYVATIVAILLLINTAAHHWTTLYRQWHYTQLRNLAGFLWFVGAVYHWVSRLVTLPERAWRRLSLEGPTKLTVSSTGLSWCNSNQRQQLGWDQYYGYVVLSEELIFVSRMPYIVPRSTVSPVDIERLLTIAKQHLPPVKWFDSRTGRISPASPVR